MGLTSALFAGLTGMKSNEFRMDVIGDNIANVNTYGYKSSRAGFQTQFARTFSFGTAPAGNVGGANPMQVGSGAMVGSVTRDFSGGAPETTGLKTDLAIQGKGLFILEKADGSEVYSRDGSFQFNADNYLISADGFFVRGYGVDSNYQIVEGTLSRLTIPVGEITTSDATSSASFSGNLNSEGTNAVAAAVIAESDSDVDIRARLNTGTLTGAAAAALTAGTLMTDLESGGVSLFDAGNIIQLTGAIKGGQTLPTESYVVTATSTITEFAAWLEDVLGIFNSTDYAALADLDGDTLADDTGPTGLSTVPQPGVTVDLTAGSERLSIVGNMGDHNALDLSNAFTVVQGTAASAPAQSSVLPFAVPSGFTQASVESIRTSFRAYDSLGSATDIDLTMVLQSQSSTGSVWRYFAECSGDTDADRCVGTGTITFDTDGNYLSSSDGTISIDHDATGAQTAQTVTLDFSTLYGLASSSSMSLLTQDGFPAGTLADFSIGSDGVITGAFTNGLTKTLGQVVMATFRNYEGLVSQADNLFGAGPNSGDRIIKKPQELGAGTISSAALELSNVDLSREFINLIISSTGFSASSRVIQTSDRLLTELMSLTR